MAWEVHDAASPNGPAASLADRVRHIFIWRALSGELSSVGALSCISIFSLSGLSFQLSTLLLPGAQAGAGEAGGRTLMVLVYTAQRVTRVFSLPGTLASLVVALAAEWALRRERERISGPVRFPYRVAALASLFPGPLLSPVPPVLAVFLLRYLDRGNGGRRALAVIGASASLAVLATLRCWCQTAWQLSAVCDTFSLLPDSTESSVGMLRLEWERPLPPGVTRLRIIYQVSVAAQ
ncbi:hypothetical protein T484DRAFT_1760114 [Baffinella frigidus]|nr:hypothetical protein T484DRAFT_1760114 [Cryptophyta sp. CCMP2293]